MAMEELPEAPEGDIEQREAERKKNVTENLRILTKRFGESFVKGARMEGGGYTGGGARELLAGFLELPTQKFPGAGFVDKQGKDLEISFGEVVKRIIPNTKGALQLLKDNHAYIQATLEQLYEDSSTHDMQPVKDPYELARSVGYELTGPFTSTAEFVLYDKLDFPSWGKLGTERLCTFNEPVERLEEYHMLWLRRIDVAETLPADKLTEDTLSESWKTYLKTIGRYDKETDKYNLVGLRPTRDDPYGTSSMSVQISRTGAHVSIKNRYNHMVLSPDNTLKSDLDNVAYGLKRSVYSLVGREDLMKKSSIAIAEGYIVDNDRGIHPYKFEEDNVYYGEYEYIRNGVVTTIDRGIYDMISPQLYVPKSGKGDMINLRPNSTELTVGSDVKFLYEQSSKDDKKDPRIAELRQVYAERDKAELKRLLNETLTEQARAAYDTYRDVALQLGASEIMTEAAFAGLLERKQSEWQTNGVMDYLVKELIEKDSRPNLVATPNVIADWQQLKHLAVEFGSDQPHKTLVYGDLYEQYTPEQLSGALTDELVRLNIIPSGYNLRGGTVAHQREQLATMQSEQPELSFRVPSVLDSLMLWKVLRSRGYKLDSDTFGFTPIRYFDLPEKQLDGWSLVPFSCVYDDGEPFLGRSLAGGVHGARVSVG